MTITTNLARKPPAAVAELAAAADAKDHRNSTLEQLPDSFRGEFFAMGSPCEVITEATSRADAKSIVDLVSAEAWRMEDKFSRYLKGNIIDKINGAQGRPVVVDDETAGLLDFAAQLWELSEGGFDVTSGVLRRAWTFDGGSNIPGPEEVQRLLALVGWQKVRWSAPELRLTPDMEIDFGGIAKEVAVDKAAAIARNVSTAATLVNFGGDLAVTAAPASRDAWRIGIEGQAGAHDRTIRLRQGAVSTSGDARRYLQKSGVRYGHVLDPRTGWPVHGAPQSVTVAADTCTEAGMLSTMALLKGADAEKFLKKEKKTYWCRRD